MTFASRLMLVSALFVLLEASVVRAQAPARDEAAALEFFEKKVRPLLSGNCYNCHSTNFNSNGGLRLDDRNALLAGGRSGPAIVPGQPEKSLLIAAVSQTHEKLKMPPKKQLSADQVEDLTKWIKDGAAWPRPHVPDMLGKPNPKFEQIRKEHWAWQPLHVAQAPTVRDTSWPRDDVDRFVLAKLEEKGLKPLGDADRAELLRRLTFDLTGLPPTLEEIDAFLEQSSTVPQAAYEKAIDRLLAAPAFGERWGRHWLDVARYGESTGSARNLPYPQAWRYRDYVIDAFNADKPYDRFIQEQIAGDLLPAQSQKDRDELTVATGFLALGVKDVNQRYKVRYVMDNIDEQIDTVCRAVLAMTASCARCHDHKFDPIPTTDYYALAGIFHSTDLCAGLRNKMGGGGLDYYDTSMLLQVGPPTVDPKLGEKIAKAKQAVEAARKEFEAIRGTPEGMAVQADGKPKQLMYRLKMEQLQGELAALTDPAAQGKVALGVREAKTVGDTEVRIRGEAEALGPVQPRGFLSLLEVPGAPKINPNQSGRLELARWLTSANNPLAQRVIVNRVWQHLFSQGLVSIVDNFGTTGDRPSHPELLDHLADRFVKDGWSVKKLIKTLVLTRAYQLSSTNPQSEIRHPKSADPANRLVWRHSPRRLDAEEIRDATLAIADRLNVSRPDASPAKALKVVEMPNNGNEARRILDAANASKHRSIYLPLVRTLVPTALEVFDFAEQGMVTGSRDTTTVAPQALYLLNDPFVRRNALALAERALKRTDLDESDRVNLVYRLTLGRTPTEKETLRAGAYLADYAAAFSQSPQPKPVAKKKAPVTVKKDSQAPVNPDDIDRTDAPVNEDAIQAADPQTAAWMSFCQALLASAEFRYIK